MIDKFLMGSHDLAHMKELYLSSISNASISSLAMYQEGPEQLQASVDRLHALAAHLQSIREEERISIAREVHDELGQALTALKMDVAWVRKQVCAGHHSGSPCQVGQRLDVMSQLIDDTTDIARNIVNQLRPAVLDTLGLLPALQWQIRVFSERTGLPVETSFSFDGAELCHACETAVFRIVQEALTNVARHAQATHVRLVLQADGACARLDINDNGVGMPHSNPAADCSLGITGMRERAVVFGGEVGVVSPPGRGTTVSVYFPMHCSHTP